MATGTALRKRTEGAEARLERQMNQRRDDGQDAQDHRQLLNGPTTTSECFAVIVNSSL
jgi:hypothetical protein